MRILTILFLFLIVAGGRQSFAQAGVTVDIAIESFDFMPDNQTIEIGTTVRWTNNDFVGHTATSDDGVFASPLLNNGEQFSYTFNATGVFPYHCTPHPSMTDTITVVSTGSDVVVDIAGFSFSPADISVESGTVVTWTNSHSVTHTSTADDASWDSGSLAPGESFSFLFTTTGNYPYKCLFHPTTMTGTVTVTEPQPTFICGDVNDDGIVNLLDILFYIDYKYKDGPAPVSPDAADVNNDGAQNLLDILYLIDFKYKEGDPPNCP